MMSYPQKREHQCESSNRITKIVLSCIKESKKERKEREIKRGGGLGEEGSNVMQAIVYHHTP